MADAEETTESEEDMTDDASDDQPPLMTVEQYKTIPQDALWWSVIADHRQQGGGTVAAMMGGATTTGDYLVISTNLGRSLAAWEELLIRVRRTDPDVILVQETAARDDQELQNPGGTLLLLEPLNHGINSAVDRHVVEQLVKHLFDVPVRLGNEVVQGTCSYH